MNKLILYIIFLLLSFIFFHSSAQASVLFQDNFDLGNDNQWTRKSGQSLWQVSNIDGSNRYGAVINSGSTIIDTIAGDQSWTDYIFEMDMLAKQGVDKNIRLRWNDAQGGFTYGFHFNPILHTSGGTNTFFSLQNDQTYHIKVIAEGTHFQLFVDGIKVSDDFAPGVSLAGTIGLTVSTGAAFPTEVWFDNIVVRTIDDDSLDVPLLKQTDPPWGSQLYDAANLWAPSNSTIEKWGCALTSAAMVFQYNKINKLPGNINLNPGTLNTWLKSQNDGYVRNGLINWLALSRLSKLVASINPGFVYDSLEFYKITGAHRFNLLRSLIVSEIPGIIEVPNHFVVAKGKTDDTFLINDPFNNFTDLTSYSNTFSSLNIFVPSFSDLSYIMAVVDKDIEINAIDSLGNPVGFSDIQEPLHEDGGSQISGPAVKVFYIVKPNSGNYILSLSSSQNSDYLLDLYMYDENGNVKKINTPGIVSSQNSDSFAIQFNKNNSSSSSTTQNGMFENLLKDLITLRSTNDVDRIQFKLLEAKVKTAAHLSTNKNTKKGSINMLKAMDKQLSAKKNKGISQNAYNILHADIQSILLSSL